MTRILTARDAHFAWLLGEQEESSGLTRPPDGIESPDVLDWIRRTTAALARAGCPGSWLILEGDEVVGMCSLKAPPDPRGVAEIGYGIAESRRRRGHAGAAVALIIAEISILGLARRITAETAIDNLPSQKVLAANGFVRVGRRHDAEDGELVLWVRDIDPAR